MASEEKNKAQAPKRGVGQPSKCTAEVVDQIVKTVAMGNYIETACALMGVPRSTMYSWMTRGKEALKQLADDREGNPRAKLPKTEEPYVYFVEQMRIAMAQSESRDVLTIAAAAQGGQTIAAKTKTKTTERVLPDGTREVETTTESVETKLPPAWQAAAWRLERKAPGRYGRQVQITGRDGGPVATQAQVHFYVPENNRDQALKTRQAEQAAAPVEDDLPDFLLPPGTSRDVDME